MKKIPTKPPEGYYLGRNGRWWRFYKYGWLSRSRAMPSKTDVIMLAWMHYNLFNDSN